MASAARTGSPASSARTPGGGSSSARMRSTTACCSASATFLIPKASVAVRRSAVMTARENDGGHGGEQGAHARDAERQGQDGEEQRGQR